MAASSTMQYVLTMKPKRTFQHQGGKMKKIKFVSACIVGAIGLLIILVLNRFDWGRRLNGWALKI